eukprot:13644568-Alexandrium_andersonii.AAC.1
MESGLSLRARATSVGGPHLCDLGRGALLGTPVGEPASAQLWSGCLHPCDFSRGAAPARLRSGRAPARL